MIIALRIFATLATNIGLVSSMAYQYHMEKYRTYRVVGGGDDDDQSPKWLKKIKYLIFVSFGTGIVARGLQYGLGYLRWRQGLCLAAEYYNPHLLFFDKIVLSCVVFAGSVYMLNNTKAIRALDKLGETTNLCISLVLTVGAISAAHGGAGLFCVRTVASLFMKCL